MKIKNELIMTEQTLYTGLVNPLEGPVSRPAILCPSIHSSYLQGRMKKREILRAISTHAYTTERGKILRAISTHAYTTERGMILRAISTQVYTMYSGDEC